MRWAIVGAWLWALLLCSPSAHAKWFEASSDHFVIYADDNEADLKRFAGQLEAFHSALAHLFESSAEPPSPSSRVTVFVVRNETQVQELYGARGGFLNGFYVPNAAGSIAVVPRVDAKQGQAGFSMIVLLHEYTHHFLISSTGFQMPRWISEGAAEFFSSCSFERDGALILGRPANHRAGELLYARDVPIARLLGVTTGKPTRNQGYDEFYGKSWALYHYLTLGRARSGQLKNYQSLLVQGKSPADAAREAFGDLDALERELAAYLRQRSLTALRLTPDMLRIGKVTVRELSAGEAAVMPVRIRSRRGVDEERARKVVVDAREVAARFPGDAAVLAALAEAEFDAGDDKAAIAAADAALAIDPRTVNAYVQKGFALFRMAADAPDRLDAFKRARAPFLALNRLENDHPLPLIYYYRSFAEAGIEPPEVAVSGLVRAMQLAPFDLGLRMDVARALIGLARQPEARIALQPVAFNPHGGSLVEAAQRVLSRLDASPNWRGEGYDALMAAPATEADQQATDPEG